MKAFSDQRGQMPSGGVLAAAAILMAGYLAVVGVVDGTKKLAHAAKRGACHLHLAHCPAPAAPPAAAPQQTSPDLEAGQ